MDQRILWFLDSAALTTAPERLPDLSVATTELIAAAGNSDFQHEIVDPFPCLDRLTQQLQIRDFSAIIDLTQVIHPHLQHWDDIPVISDFHISRLRKISSSRLDGCGHVVSLTDDDISSRSASIDFSRPLILDDVGWSGKTIVETMRMFNLKPTQTTVGFLVTNTGNFGEGKPGAFDQLTRMGVSVLSGMEVHTPADDGFHLYRLYPRCSINTERNSVKVNFALILCRRTFDP